MPSNDDVQIGMKVFGVVSLLDEAGDSAVREIWSQFERVLGLAPIAETMAPHFSYAVAEDYDMDALDRIVGGIAGRTAPFEVETWGVFSMLASPQAMAWLPISRDSALEDFHRLVYEAVKPAASGNMDRYQPEGWAPHISLTPDGLEKPVLPELARILGDSRLAWTITIDNLALLRDSGSRQAVERTWRFEGSGDA
jgi:hypothetical protein